jgi:GntR family transcriptional regulator
MTTLDKNSSIPLRIQFKEYLTNRIDRNELKPGQRLPSERAFCEQFGISRITVRQALAEMARDGLIYTVPGKGTFIARKQTFRPLVSLSQQIRERGQIPSNRILKQEIIHAPVRLARVLQIQVGSEVAKIERLRFADDESYAVQSIYIPHALCLNILTYDFETGSLLQILGDGYGLMPVSADSEFEARLATSDEEQLFRLPRPSAVLVMRQTSYLENNVPIVYIRFIFRANESLRSTHGVLVSDRPSG